jgi:hypothetical protein
VTAPPSPPARPGVLDVMARSAGAVVAVWGAVVLSAYGAFLTPFRLGQVLMPVAVVLAVGGNALLIRFAHGVTGNKMLALLPGLVWLVLSFIGAERTTEGDLVLYQSNWVATVYLFAGAGTVAVFAYRLLVPATHSR